MSELRLGWWLSSEEHSPRDLVGHAQLAESVGFPTAMLSDHLLPWVRRQGHAGHAWAPAAVLFEDRFFLGVGSGERLNEQPFASRWPRAGERRERLREAVA